MKPAAGPRVVAHLTLQVGGVVVAELAHLAEGEPRAVEDAGMVLLVEVDIIALADQTRDGAQVHLEAGGEDDRGFLSHELGQAALQLHVQIERSVEEPAAGAARAVPADGLHGGLFDPGVVCEAEVVLETSMIMRRPSSTTSGLADSMTRKNVYPPLPGSCPIPRSETLANTGPCGPCRFWPTERFCSSLLPRFER